MTKLSILSNISLLAINRLSHIDVESLEALLELGESSAGRHILTSQSEQSPQTVLMWVRQADLMRVKGIGAEYAELLIWAGVYNLSCLREQAGPSLLERLKEVNRRRRLVKRLPALNRVNAWIAESHTLPLILEEDEVALKL